MTLLTEIGDITRFGSPRGLMGDTGLVPAEHARGDKHRRGPITKTGNVYLRRVLVEAAWHNWHKVGGNQKLRNRRLGQNRAVVAIAMKAHRKVRSNHIG